MAKLEESRDGEHYLAQPFEAGVGALKVAAENGNLEAQSLYGPPNLHYAFRVTEFKTYLENKYKPADISGGDRSEFSGQQGIIMFDVDGWSDATGHFDLWNGSECRGSDDFDNAHAVYLWTCG